MGLMDILNGMQNGPRGRRQPSGTGTSSTGSSGNSSGMSPLTMALLGLLAYKALKHFGGSGQPEAAPANPGARPIPGTVPANLPGTPANPGANPGATAGGLGDLLKGGLGGLLAGGAAGSVLTGGLNDLLRKLDHSGHGDVANSWVGTGPNKKISSGALRDALGDDTVKTLADQAGLSQVELLSGLSRQLPSFIDQLTPQGRVPTEEEMSRMV